MPATTANEVVSSCMTTFARLDLPGNAVSACSGVGDVV